MKLIISIKTLLLGLLCAFCLHGQDIHYSQFNWIPVLANPAMSGHLPDADMQYGAIYRDQGFTVTPNAYNSFSVFADTKVSKGFRSRDYLGLGLMLLHDNAGTGALTTNGISFNLAYHFPLSEKNTLSWGGQGSVFQRSYGDFAAFSFEEELSGSTFSEALQNDNRQYFDGHTGLLFTSRSPEEYVLQIGGSVYHFNNRSAITDLSSIDKFTLRYSTFATFDYQLNDRLDIEPRLQFQYTERARELMGQVVLAYLISEFYNTNVKLKFGGGLRWQDAWQVILGAEYGNWEVGFAYDSNISGLSAGSGAVAGLELGLKYRHLRPEKKEKPKKQPKPVIQEIEPYQIDLSLLEENQLDSVRISISEGPVIVEDLLTSTYPYLRDLQEDKTYTILVEKPGYIPATVSFTTTGIRRDSTIEKIVVLKLIPVEEEVVVVPPPVEEKTVPVPPQEPTPPVVVTEIPPVVEEIPPVIAEEVPPVVTEKTPTKEEVIVANPPVERPPISETEEVIIYREEPFILKNILYDFDDDKILARAEKDLRYLLNLLRTYPDMVIELSSHTDVRGSEEYNEKLSQWRAESARLWLLDRGISEDRIRAKGYGESQIINGCVEGVTCSDEEHRQNRRTEFKIIAGPTSVRYRVN